MICKAHNRTFAFAARHPLVIDNFAGGGGASTGIEAAIGRQVDVAINHDPKAVAMHRANHPHTLHLCQDVWQADPAAICGGQQPALCWFSPDCTDHSKAKGGKPIRDTQSRDLAWVVLRWAAKVRPRVVMLENVEEFADWGPLTRKRGRAKHPRACRHRRGRTFAKFVSQLEGLGYAVEWRELRACDYGAPTIRKRLFLVARCDGQPIVWPEPTHGEGLLPYRTAAECIDWSLPCPSIFLTREQAQAYYEQTGQRINRPLAAKTMARIANGVRRYVLEAKEPFLVTIANYGRSGGIRDAAEPLRTITAQPKGGSEALIVPYTIPRYGEAPGQQPRARSIDDPAPTITPTANGGQLVAAHLQRMFGQSIGGEADAPCGSLTGKNKTGIVAATLSKYHGSKAGEANCIDPGEPIGTLDTSNRYALVAAFLAKHFGGVVGVDARTPLPTTTARGTQTQIVAAHLSHLYTSNTNGGQGDPEKPLKTITTGNHASIVASFLAPYYSSGSGKTGRDLREPAPTLTTNDRLQLVTVDLDGEPYILADIGMRMLTPRELYRCQGFPDRYIIDQGVDEQGRQVPLTKSEQVRSVGNSVVPQLAEALVRANLPELCERPKAKRRKRKAVTA